MKLETALNFDIDDEIMDFEPTDELDTEEVIVDEEDLDFLDSTDEKTILD